MHDIQRAPVSKRLFAFLADVILAGLLAAGLFLVLSTVFKTDSYRERYERIKAEYEQKYGVTFDLTNEEYNALGKEAQQNYSDAVDAMNGDADAETRTATAFDALNTAKYGDRTAINAKADAALAPYRK